MEQKIKNFAYKGFTLMELMVVIVIIAILSLISIPQYTKYVTRAKISEGIALSNEAKNAVSEFYIENGSFPNSSDFELPEVLYDVVSGENVTGITILDNGYGVVKIQYKHKLLSYDNNYDVVYQIPELDSFSTRIVKWICATPIEGNFKYLPPNCRNLSTNYFM